MEKKFGLKRGEELGRKQGEQIGKEKEQKEIAKKLLKIKMTNKQISEITGLTEEKIKELQSE